MRKTLLLVPALALLAGCMSPREACIADARSTVRSLEHRISIAEGNIARGYALADVSDTRIVNDICTGTNSDGSTFTYSCPRTESYTRQEPVAISVAEERIKLADLQRQLQNAIPAANAAVQQCIAIHPE